MACCTDHCVLAVMEANFPKWTKYVEDDLSWGLHRRTIISRLSNSKKLSPSFWSLTKIRWLPCFLTSTTFHLWIILVVPVWVKGERLFKCVFSPFLLGSSFPYKKWTQWLISYSVTLGLCSSFRNLATVPCSFLPACMPRFPSCRWWTWWATISHCDRELGWGQDMSRGRELGKPCGAIAGLMHIYSFPPAIVKSSCFWSDFVDSFSISILTSRSEKSFKSF